MDSEKHSMTRKYLYFLIACLLACSQLRVSGQEATEDLASSIFEQNEIRIVQLVEGEPVRRHHPSGLPTLLKAMSDETTLTFNEDPIFINSFEDPRLFDSPITYANYADRSNWELTEKEIRALRRYLNGGGFLYIDAGINAAFLRDNPLFGQNHSFGDWEITPELGEQFTKIFSTEAAFIPLHRSHAIFQGYHSGLPDPEPLPEAIRDFIVNEKWPQGSYSVLGLHDNNGRLMVVATPIIALGWGKDRLGRWVSQISFRVRESAKELDASLQTAAYSGQKFEVTRPDGLKDVIYCQPANMPAWVHEADGSWRVFKYYQGEAISDYAHEFYTRLGMNIFIFALTQG